jgi:diaminopropionate ammonia-lyase
MRALINHAYDRKAVPAAAEDALLFHRSMRGYAPTPVRQLDALASELGLAAIQVKDESDRFGLPAFKILGASWATERALRERPSVTTLIAASAGNHGRAVARCAAWRGLSCQVFLPRHSLAVRRTAIADEGAEVIVVDGGYQDAVDMALAAGAGAEAAVIADVGVSGPPEWVIDGYATIFAEVAAQVAYDLILVPVGVGSLAAAAARHGAQTGACVVSVEPAAAPCLIASLAGGTPTAVATPGTAMAGLDGRTRLLGGLPRGVADPAPRHHGRTDRQR